MKYLICQLSIKRTSVNYFPARLYYYMLYAFKNRDNYQPKIIKKVFYECFFFIKHCALFF